MANRKEAIKVNACAVCGYDARVFRNGHKKVKPPMILGHELCGEIQETIKTKDTEISAGSRVAVCPLVPCLSCQYCASAQYNLCLQLGEMGSSIDGGFAEYAGIPKQIIKIGGLVPVPDNLNDEEAALLEPLACCLNGYSKIRMPPKDGTAVVIGDGPIGLLHLQLLKNIFGARVSMVGRIPARMQKAREIGADAVFAFDDIGIAAPDILDFSGADVIIIATSNPAAFELATKVAGKNSVINLFAGMPTGQSFAFDPNWLHYNQVSITASFSSTPAILRQAAEIAAARAVDLSLVITHRYALSEIDQAMHTTENYFGLRAVINKF